MKNNIGSIVLISLGFILLNVVTSVEFLSIDYIYMIIAAILFVVGGNMQK